MAFKNPDWIIYLAAGLIAGAAFFLGQMNARGEGLDHTEQYCQREKGNTLAPFGAYMDPIGRGMVVWCVGPAANRLLKYESKPMDWATPTNERAEQFCRVEFNLGLGRVDQETGRVWCVDNGKA